MFYNLILLLKDNLWKNIYHLHHFDLNYLKMVSNVLKKALDHLENHDFEDNKENNNIDNKDSIPKDDLIIEEEEDNNHKFDDSQGMNEKNY